MSSVVEGVGLVDKLWGLFGPRAASWTGTRPFDLDGGVVEVDGFDFDIEKASLGKST